MMRSRWPTPPQRLFEPAYAGLVRVAAAEARSFPELASTFLQQVLYPVSGELRSALVEANEAGRLREVDLDVAVQQLIGLCVGYAMPEVLFGRPCLTALPRCAAWLRKTRAPSCTAC
jgi:hypothetical protein